MSSMNLKKLNQLVQDIKNNKTVRKGDVIKLKASDYLYICAIEPEVGKKICKSLLINLQNKGRIRIEGPID